MAKSRGSKATPQQRTQNLERAKEFALQGSYESALQIIDDLLAVNRLDIDALRLKGNVLDLEVVHQTELLSNTEKANKIELAKQCYEEALNIAPNNVLALIDIADFWREQQQFAKALGYYDHALELLKHRQAYLSLEDEMDEAYAGKLETLRMLGDEKAVAACEEEVGSWNRRPGRTTDRS